MTAEQIDALANVPANWDSYGGLPVTDIALNVALRWATALPLEDGFACPVNKTKEGSGVQLEWHQDGWDLEISIEANGSRSWWFRRGQWEQEGTMFGDLLRPLYRERIIRSMQNWEKD
jgi:hypothetical protein